MRSCSSKIQLAYIFPSHQYSVCTFSTAIPCHRVTLQNGEHSLAGNFQDKDSETGRRMALGHTKSSLDQKWLLALGFCIAVSCHKVQFLVFCAHIMKNVVTFNYTIYDFENKTIHFIFFFIQYH